MVPECTRMYKHVFHLIHMLCIHIYIYIWVIYIYISIYPYKYICIYIHEMSLTLWIILDVLQGAVSAGSYQPAVLDRFHSPLCCPDIEVCLTLHEVPIHLRSSFSVRVQYQVILILFFHRKKWGLKLIEVGYPQWSCPIQSFPTCDDFINRRTSWASAAKLRSPTNPPGCSTHLLHQPDGWVMDGQPISEQKRVVASLFQSFLPGYATWTWLHLYCIYIYVNINNPYIYIYNCI